MTACALTAGAELTRHVRFACGPMAPSCAGVNSYWLLLLLHCIPMLHALHTVGQFVCHGVHSLSCRVLPTPRKNLSEAQTAELIRVAALPPDRRLAAYKAVLQHMVSGWQLFSQWGVNISTTLMQVDIVTMLVLHVCTQWTVQLHV